MKRFCRTAAFVLFFMLLFSASAAADHEIRQALEPVLGDEVLDEKAGAVAPVGVAAV